LASPARMQQIVAAKKCARRVSAPEWRHGNADRQQRLPEARDAPAPTFRLRGMKNRAAGRWNVTVPPAAFRSRRQPTAKTSRQSDEQEFSSQRVTTAAPRLTPAYAHRQSRPCWSAVALRRTPPSFRRTYSHPHSISVRRADVYNAPHHRPSQSYSTAVRDQHTMGNEDNTPRTPHGRPSSHARVRVVVQGRRQRGMVVEAEAVEGSRWPAQRRMQKMIVAVYSLQQAGRAWRVSRAARSAQHAGKGRVEACPQARWYAARQQAG